MSTAPLGTERSFHSIRRDSAERAITAALESHQITARDAALIREYLGELKSCSGISDGRVNKNAYIMVGWRRYLGPYDSLTIGDIYTGRTAFENARNGRGTPYKLNTRHDWIKELKRFLLWLIENKYLNLPAAKVQKLRTPPTDTSTKVSGDLLTTDEIKAMIRACRSSADRAIIMTLYEGGFRIGEVGRMRWGDLKFDEFGVVANVTFKTGKPRYIRLVMAREYLAQWRADYPHTPEGKAFVFLNSHGKELIHATISSRLERIAKRAGIQKHFTPHIFRHSRITHLITQGMNESVIKLMMWGNLTTNMFETYAHLSGADIDAEVLRNYGIKTVGPRKEEAKMEPVQCKVCMNINPPVSQYCSLCGLALTQEAEAEVRELQKFVVSHPEDVKSYLDHRGKESVGVKG